MFFKVKYLNITGGFNLSYTSPECDSELSLVMLHTIKMYCGHNEQMRKYIVPSLVMSFNNDDFCLF